MVEAAGIEPASRISLIVVVHKFIQFWCNETEKSWLSWSDPTVAGDSLWIRYGLVVL